MDMEDKHNCRKLRQNRICFSESVFNAWKSGILITDHSNIIINTNHNFASFFGKSVDEMLDTNLLLWMGKADSDASKKWTIVLKKIHDEGGINKFEYRSMGRIFEINGIRVEYNGDSQSILWDWRDETERKLAEKAFQKSREQLNQAQKMEALGTLVAGVAHEINNPVSLIMFNIPLLEKIWNDFLPVFKELGIKEPGKKYGGLDHDFIVENLRQLLSDVDMAANRITKIVSDLKNFAAQSSAADKEPVQINLAVENAIRLARVTPSKSHIDLETNLDPDLPLIKGNIRNIEQVVLNLAINAIQAIDHEYGKIKITTGLQNKDGRIYISISDNGRGIDPAISDKIFDPFVTDKQSDGGTGLGLSVTYSLVQSHDGEITLKSKPGEGTTFTVFFPSIISETAARILVVDDDEMVRQILKEALGRERSYLVDEASNGIEACIKLGSYRPDLLILDIFMPHMDGLEVCRTIKTDSNLSDMKVIVTTGFSNHQKIKDVVSLGFNNIYYKPFDLQNFVTAVDNILIA